MRRLHGCLVSPVALGLSLRSSFNEGAPDGRAPLQGGAFGSLPDSVTARGGPLSDDALPWALGGGAFAGALFTLRKSPVVTPLPDLGWSPLVFGWPWGDNCGVALSQPSP